MMTKRTIAILFTGICLGGMLAPAAIAQDAADGEWSSLFNGKDLEGWTPKIRGYATGDNFGNTFRVEDGAIKVSYDQYNGEFKERFGHLFYNQPFANYRLRVEYRFVGDQIADGPGWAFRNSGIMIHGQDPETMDKDQDFPVSIEVQLLGGDGKAERNTGNLCTPGTHVVMDKKLIRQHCINSSSKTFHGDQWVTAEVEVRGNTIKHFINGEQVLEYNDPQLDDRDPAAKKLLDGGHPLLLTKGSISLQSESHPVEFRKVEIQLINE